MTRHSFNPPIFLLVSLLVSGGLLRTDAADVALVNSTILENNVVYLRINQVEKNLTPEISAARQKFMATNQIIGTILDLRFADGNDLAAAKAAANLFAIKKQPLAILVNSQTRDAAAALAMSLQAARAGLILGGTATDLKPDITVTVGADAERTFLKNPYATVLNETNSSVPTNNFSPFIDHTSEADLVRAKIKDGEENEDFQPVRPAEPQKPTIHDPVLARAVDLIKALAVLRQPPR